MIRILASEETVTGDELVSLAALCTRGTVADGHVQVRAATAMTTSIRASVRSERLSGFSGRAAERGRAAEPGCCAACGERRLAAHLAVDHAAAQPSELVPSTTSFGVALSDIVRCLSCGHMQLARLPSTAELSGAYAAAESGDYIEEETGQRATARVTLLAIERHRATGDLLDLGCWVGFALDEARLRGWRPVGVEPSAFASSFARERLGLDVRTSELLDADLEPGTFDAAIMDDVLEHLPDPGRALDRVAELLRTGGVLHLALPDAGSALARAMGRRWWSVLPTHVHYFTRHSLSVLLERRGWTVLELRTAPKAFTVRYYLGRLAGYSPPLSRCLISLARRVGISERLWAPDFRDRMAVVAGAPKRLPAAAAKASEHVGSAP